MKNTRWLIIIKQKQSARIKCKKKLFKPCVRSKQPRTIKKIICKDILTSLTLYSRLKKMTNDGNLFSFIFFVNSIYTSD